MDKYEEVRKKKEAILPEMEPVIRKIIVPLYTEDVHFIFELLQNAEDCGARQVLFDLKPTGLSFYHDGPKLFDDNDIHSICSCALSTKEHDDDSFGQFGIGFKSVYAYTASPEIHCGGEHFRIERYMLPHPVTHRSPGDDFTTLFIFPFDLEDKKPAELAFLEISTALRELNSSSLLFLRHIEELAWKIVERNDYSDSAHVLREEEIEDAEGVRRVKCIDDRSGESEFREWLIFEASRDAFLEGQVKPSELAFEIDGETGQVKPQEQTPLFVYFPTEVRTGFGFLVQAPFDVTPARNTIKTTKKNKELIHQASELLEQAMRYFKACKMVEVGLLNSLPINDGAFTSSHVLHRFLEKTVQLFREQQLIPTSDGRLAKAQDISLPEGVADLIDPGQLTLLFQSSRPLSWIKRTITRDREANLWLFFNKTLEIKALDPEAVIRLTSDAFFQTQSDEWLVSFYKFLGNRRYFLPKSAFIRLDNDESVKPFDANNKPLAYLVHPSTEKFPGVKKCFLEDEAACKFLKDRVGLTEPDAIAHVLKTILPKYKDVLHDFNRNEYCRDLEEIANALDQDVSRSRLSSFEEEISKTPLLWCEDNTCNKFQFMRPGDCYLQSEDLLSYFEGHSAWFVSVDVLTDPISDKFPFGKIGVNVLPVSFDHKMSERRKAVIEADVQRVDRISNNSYRIFSDYTLDGVNSFLDTIPFNSPMEQARRAEALWNILGKMASRHNVFRGRFEYMYHRVKHHYFPAHFVNQLSEMAWIPVGESGTLKSPSELFDNQLPLSYDPNPILYEHLRIRRFGRMQEALCEQIGVDPDDLQQFMNHKDEFQTYLAQRNLVRDQNPFHEEDYHAPAPRAEAVSREYANSSPRTYQNRERSVRVSRSGAQPDAYLQQFYQEDCGRVRCQICLELNFLKDDDEPHMARTELTRFLSESDFVWLSLCDSCQQSYRYFVVNKQTADSLLEMLRGSESSRIAISLDRQEKFINFHPQHLQDLINILIEDTTGQSQ